MTRAELKKYTELQQIFEKDVNRVADILVKDQKRYHSFNYYKYEKQKEKSAT